MLCLPSSIWGRRQESPEGQHALKGQNWSSRTATCAVFTSVPTVVLKALGISPGRILPSRNKIKKQNAQIENLRNLVYIHH